MKSLIVVTEPVRGEVAGEIGSGVDLIRERGSRSLHNKKRGTWEKRSKAGRKKNVVKKRNTPKRVLTPGKNTKVYTRRRTKAE